MSTNNTIHRLIREKSNRGESLFAVLIDPGKLSTEDLQGIIDRANEHPVDLFLVGGSLVSEPLDETLLYIKKRSSIPTVIFPGSLFQLSKHADAILLLSLISGRNPDLLIGQHVQAAPFLKKNKIETLATGYILIGDHANSSVSYMSNTRPIPADKTDIIIATALAGEQTGNQIIYLEGGSGSKQCIPTELIRLVKDNLSIPLVVGGGITSKEQAREIFRAGADMVVVGNALEQRHHIQHILS